MRRYDPPLLGREIVMSVPASPKGKRLLCRFNLRHKWVRRFNGEGDDYLECAACGKYKDYKGGAGFATPSGIA